MKPIERPAEALVGKGKSMAPIADKHGNANRRR